MAYMIGDRELHFKQEDGSVKVVGYKGFESDMNTFVELVLEKDFDMDAVRKILDEKAIKYKEVYRLS